MKSRPRLRTARLFAVMVLALTSLPLNGCSPTMLSGVFGKLLGGGGLLGMITKGLPLGGSTSGSGPASLVSNLASGALKSSAASAVGKSFSSQTFDGDLPSSTEAAASIGATAATVPATGFPGHDES